MHTYLTSLVIFGPKLGGRQNIVISTVSLFALACFPLLRVASQNQIQNIKMFNKVTKEFKDYFV